MEHEFKPFGKIPRYRRHILITEKLDGTNGLVFVAEDGTVKAGSRNRWLSPETKQSDNFGFAKWVAANEEDLRLLGPGYHYGEWYGVGIGRGYDLFERRFALFNVKRWGVDPSGVARLRPACCGVVPVLYSGDRDDDAVDRILDSLRTFGSIAVPHFMKPEGIVILDTAANTLHKITCERDEAPKGKVA